MRRTECPSAATRGSLTAGIEMQLPASSPQPCLAIGPHRLFQIASFGGKDALHWKTTLFQEIGERRVFARILLDKLAVDLNHALREVEVAKVVNALALHDLPYALALLDLIIETGMCTDAQIEAHVLTNDNGIGLDDGLVAIAGYYWRANEVLGTQIRLAHSHRAIDEIASQTLKP